MTKPTALNQQYARTVVHNDPVLQRAMAKTTPNIPHHVCARMPYCRCPFGSVDRVLVWPCLAPHADFPFGSVDRSSKTGRFQLTRRNSLRHGTLRKQDAQPLLTRLSRIYQRFQELARIPCQEACTTRPSVVRTDAQPCQMTHGTLSSAGQLYGRVSSGVVGFHVAPSAV